MPNATWLPALGIALVVAWVGLAAALERRKERTQTEDLDE